MAAVVGNKYIYIYMCVCVCVTMPGYQQNGLVLVNQIVINKPSKECNISGHK